MAIDLGNLSELFDNVWVLLVALVAGVWYASKVWSRLNNHEARLTGIEADTKDAIRELGLKIDALARSVYRLEGRLGVKPEPEQEKE